MYDAQTFIHCFVCVCVCVCVCCFFSGHIWTGETSIGLPHPDPGHFLQIYRANEYIFNNRCNKNLIIIECNLPLFCVLLSEWSCFRLFSTFQQTDWSVMKTAESKRASNGVSLVSRGAHTQSSPQSQTNSHVLCFFYFPSILHMVLWPWDSSVIFTVCNVLLP